MTKSASAGALRIALLGSRGIPNRYGGYETLMEELARRLVERGHRVTVYCRSHSTPKTLRQWKGVDLVVLPTLRGKYFDTPVHTLLSVIDAGFRRFDAALVVNSANAVFVPWLRLTRIPAALHVDGIEKRRRKWGPVGRAVYALSERLATFVPNLLITDAEVIRKHYEERYGAASVPITYGVDPVVPEGRATLDRLSLEARRYFLYVSRFEPENNPDRVAAAYRRVGGDLPLVMVGGAPYAAGFIAGFTADADRRILFPGPIYGEGYRELLSHALAYIHATEVGGTHPALVEAMGYGNCLVVNRTPENVEVAGDQALYFEAGDEDTLSRALEEVRSSPEAARRRGEAAAERAQRLYSWQAVTDQYEAALWHLAHGTDPQ
ncbi:MAG: DUF1972 domain-containing protein [Acidobacteriota bacterium]